jgi:hypothetical protein
VITPKITKESVAPYAGADRSLGTQALDRGSSQDTAIVPKTEISDQHDSDSYAVEIGKHIAEDVGRDGIKHAVESKEDNKGNGEDRANSAH